MALRVKISARAAGQIQRAAQWWVENRQAAPGAISTDIGQSLALLAEQPGIGSKYTSARVGTVRRLYMGRVGYFLYYRVAGDSLEVLAFWHAKRGNQPRL